MNQPDSKKIREAYHALLIMIMTFFMILIPMIPSLKAKAAPEKRKKSAAGGADRHCGDHGLLLGLALAPRSNAGGRRRFL